MPRSSKVIDFPKNGNHENENHRPPRPKTQREMGEKGHLYRDADPVMERVQGFIRNSDLRPWEISHKISRISGGGASVSHTTIHNWLDGKVKRPSNYCVYWVARACGWVRGDWHKIRPE